jgi:hypothetical protein
MYPPYLYRMMTQGGSAWALRAGEVFCSGVAELAPCRIGAADRSLSESGGRADHMFLDVAEDH